MTTEDLPSNAPRPRLCHIVKWPDFDGYGFNLHADKSRIGQYIGKVDESSPADVSGLKEGDRIVEVNGVNISNENHKQVVERIKAVSNETRLLVVDAEADKWYKGRNFIVRGDQANVAYGTSKRPAPLSDAPPALEGSPATPARAQNGDDEDRKSVASGSSSHSSTQAQLVESEVKNGRHSLPSSEEGECSAGAAEPEETEPNCDATSEEAPAAQEDPICSSDSPAEVAETPGEDVEGSAEACDAPAGADLSPDYDNIRFKSEEEEEEKEKENEKEDKTEKEDEEEEVKCDGKASTEEDEDVCPSAERQSLSSASSTASGSHVSPETEKSGSVADTEPDQEDRKSPMSTTPSPPPSLTPDTNVCSRQQQQQQNSTANNSSPSSKRNDRGLNLNMTAAEMRAHLATKKKFDPRKDTIDLKTKFQIVQNM